MITKPHNTVITQDVTGCNKFKTNFWEILSNYAAPPPPHPSLALPLLLSGFGHFSYWNPVKSLQIQSNDSLFLSAVARGSYFPQGKTRASSACSVSIFGLSMGKNGPTEPLQTETRFISPTFSHPKSRSSQQERFKRPLSSVQKND